VGNRANAPQTVPPNSTNSRIHRNHPFKYWSEEQVWYRTWIGPETGQKQVMIRVNPALAHSTFGFMATGTVHAICGSHRPRFHDGKAFFQPEKR
jgi:hypothetical protein